MPAFVANPTAFGREDRSATAQEATVTSKMDKEMSLSVTTAQTKTLSSQNNSQPASSLLRGKRRRIEDDDGGTIKDGDPNPPRLQPREKIDEAFVRDTDASSSRRRTCLGQCQNVKEQYEKLGRCCVGTTYNSGDIIVVYKARNKTTGQIVALKRFPLVVRRRQHHHKTTTTTTKTQKSGSRTNLKSNADNWDEPNTTTTTALDHCDDDEDHDAKPMEEDVPVSILRELETLRLCVSCPYIVSLYDIAVSSSSSLYLVMEYCTIDLASFIDSYFVRYTKSPFSEDAVKTLVIHLLSALSYLHYQCSIMHRDVKLSSLLYNPTQGMLKLSEFGSARQYSPTTTTLDNSTRHNDNFSNHVTLTPRVASLWYRPPEMLLGCTKYTPAIDLWAVGCVWIELLTGTPALAGNSEMDQIQRIFDQIDILSSQTTDHDIFQRYFPHLVSGHIRWPTTTTVNMFTTTSSINSNSTSHVHSLQPQRRSKYRILDQVPFLTDAGSQLLVNLLQLLPYHRWTTEEALRSPYFVEDPLPLPEPHMPRFSTLFPSS